MFISHSKKFIFIYNFKVAGSSIRDALSNYNTLSFEESNFINKVKFLLRIYPNIYSDQFPWHIKAREVKDKITESILKNTTNLVLSEIHGIGKYHFILIY